MSATILDGKLVAAAVKAEIAAAVEGLGYTPGLATVLVGDDPASHSYVRGKRADAAEVGIRSVHHELAADVTQAELEDLVETLNSDESVDGILVQLPFQEPSMRSAPWRGSRRPRTSTGCIPTTLDSWCWADPASAPAPRAGSCGSWITTEFPPQGHGQWS